MEILTEYVCKKLFNNDKLIWKISRNQLDKLYRLDTNKKYVCKVDQFVKHRKNQNLLILNSNIKQIIEFIDQVPKKYNNFIIEEYVDIEEENYLFINSNGQYDEIYLIKNIKSTNVTEPMIMNDSIKLQIGILDIININTFKIFDDMKDIIHDIYQFYLKYHFTFLEINPLAKLKDGTYTPIDFAARFDSTSLYKWDVDDIDIYNKDKLNQNNGYIIEQKIDELDKYSGSSLKFKLLNENGSIWTLVAGGGASVLYTDAIINLGYKDELANYGEYSGNPTTNELYQYSDLIVEQMLKSNSNNLMLIIGGAISNFTYVDKTFDGIIMSLKKHGNKLVNRNVKIYVRRGGLNYKKGLEMIKNACLEIGLECHIYTPDDHITNFLSTILYNKNNNKVSQIDDYKLPSKIINIIDNIQFNNNNYDIIEPKICIMNLQTQVAQRILDYDYIVNKKPSIKCFLYPPRKGQYIPLFYGDKEILVPIYGDINKIETNEECNIYLNYNSFRSSFDTSKQVLEQESAKILLIVAEGMCEREARLLKAMNTNKMIIGPSSVGAISIGNYRLGNICGSIENINDMKLYNRGSIGLLTKSGGLLNEMCNIINRTTDGVCEAVSIGGDRYPSSTFMDHIIRYENNKDIKLICLLGEVGGIDEYYIAHAVKNGIIKKPIVAWTIGTCLESMNKEISFGHAGSYVNAAYEKAMFKNNYMRKCGIYVPQVFEDIQELLSQISIKYNCHQQNITIKPNILPMDYNDLQKRNLIRKKSNFYSSISNERVKELEYNKVPVSSIISNNHSLGKTIGHLLFKLDLPEYICKFIELTMVLLADHGIAVSSAHNTAVCARAGQNISSSVASGLLCIHDKHGGAIQEAAELFYQAHYHDKLSPSEFVNRMKNKNKLIPGIGHAFKNSTTNKDKRIEIMMNFIYENFNNTDLIDFSKKVEEITLRKKENLILNVDGLIAVSFVNCIINEFDHNTIQQIINYKGLNSLFIISRTIGLCGTFIDQHRLGQGLFRETEICYL